MKRYIKPQTRTIDLYEECDILTMSQVESDSIDVGDDYADEEALSSKRNIWGGSGIWK